MNPVSLTRWGGRLLTSISILHILVFLSHPYWSEWLTGKGITTMESMALFWALPGGPAVIGILLGMLVSRMGKRGEVAPGYVGATVLAWAAGCIALLGVSGFVLMIVPALMLITATLLDRSRRRHPVDAATA